MEPGAVRTPGYSVITPAMRSVEPVNAPSVATDIPPEQAVTPSRASEALRPSAENDRETASSPQGPVKREEYRDEITDSLVFRAIDTETGEILRQIPDESLLRLRRAFAETTHKDMTGLGLNRSL